MSLKMFTGSVLSWWLKHR